MNNWGLSFHLLRELEGARFQAEVHYTLANRIRSRSSEVSLSITQLETTNLDRQYFYRKSSKFATEHLALETIYSFSELFFWLFLLDSILGQRLLFQRQHGCVVQMDVYRDCIITCTKIPHHKLKSEVFRKG